MLGLTLETIGRVALWFCFAITAINYGMVIGFDQRAELDSSREWLAPHSAGLLSCLVRLYLILMATVSAQFVVFRERTWRFVRLLRVILGILALVAYFEIFKFRREFGGLAEYGITAVAAESRLLDFTIVGDIVSVALMSVVLFISIAILGPKPPLAES